MFSRIIIILVFQVNHTWADWQTYEDWEVATRLRMEGTPPEVETCVANKSINEGHPNIKDGPFFWEVDIEVRRSLK